MVENEMGKIDVGKEDGENKFPSGRGRKLNYAVKFRNEKLTKSSNRWYVFL